MEGLVRTVAGMFQSRLPFEAGQELQSMNFTPLRAQLAQGVVTTNDVWMWNAQTAMGLQGRINLAEGRMNMTMGILGESLLRQMPFLKGLRAIGPQAVYEFPATGALSKPKVDFGKFATQLALSAGLAAAGKQGGELGQVLGGVLGDVAGGGKGGTLAAGKLAWPGKPELPPVQAQDGQEQPAQEAQPPAGQEAAPSKEPQSSPQEKPKDAVGGLLEGILQGVQQEEQRKQEERQQRRQK
jgi:hypothetical protein